MSEFFKQFYYLLRQLWTTLGTLNRKELRILVILLVVIGMLVIIIFENAPILLTATFPYYTLNYPSDGLEKLMPKQRDGKVVVLFQRVIFDVDHWNISNDPQRCGDEEEKTDCDVTHAYQSWTIVVPREGVKFKAISGSSGPTLGKIVSLTNHTFTYDPPVYGGLQHYSVTDYKQPEGKVDTIISRREFFGGFQPILKDKQQNWEPNINTCEGNSVGIAIRNPTARAELIIHTPKPLFYPHEYRIWKTTKQPNDTYATDEVRNLDNIGSLTIDADNIHWVLGTALLREADKEDFVIYHLSWRWNPSTGPVCKREATETSGLPQSPLDKTILEGGTTDRIVRVGETREPGRNVRPSIPGAALADNPGDSPGVSHFTRPPPRKNFPAAVLGHRHPRALHRRFSASVHPRLSRSSFSTRSQSPLRDDDSA